MGPRIYERGGQSIAATDPVGGGEDHEALMEGAPAAWAHTVPKGL